MRHIARLYWVGLAIVAGVTTTQSLDSIAIGLIIGSTLFALLAPLLAAATR